MQADLQPLMAAAPFSLFTQLTKMRRPLGPFFLSSIMLRGQALTQAPQLVHLSSSTSGRPVSMFMCMASKSQAATQSPQPKHPYPHAVSPAPVACMAAQVHYFLSANGTAQSVERSLVGSFHQRIGKACAPGISASATISLWQCRCHLAQSGIFLYGKPLGAGVEHHCSDKRNAPEYDDCNNHKVHNICISF